MQDVRFVDGHGLVDLSVGDVDGLHGHIAQPYGLEGDSVTHFALRGVEIRRARMQDLKNQGGRLVMLVRGKGHTEYDTTIVIPEPARVFFLPWYTLRKKLQNPKSDRLFCSLSRRNYGGEMSGAAMRRIIKAKIKELHVIGNLTTHSLRHTAITSVLKNGGTIRQAQILARHSDPKTTMIYAHEIDRLENPPEELISYE